MSTVNVTNLKHPSSTTNNIVLNSDGTVSGGLGFSNLSESTAVTLSTQTAVDFDLSTLSPMPKRITLVLQRISVSGSDSPLIQIGDSGGVETSGYSTIDSNQYSGSGDGFLNAIQTNGWRIHWNGDTVSISGHFTLTNVPSTNWWVGTGHFAANQGTSWFAWTFTGGAHELDGAIQTLRLTTTGSTALDSGRAFLQYEV